MTEAGSSFKENIINTWLNRGLKEWVKSGASIEYIGQSPHKLPVIYAPATTKDNKPITVLIATGMHDEEISGPKLTLTPEAFQKWREKGVDFYIFPIINLHGLQFPETADDKLLRYDPEGRNYNDGWGNCSYLYKPHEVELIEAAIEQISSTQKPDIAISFHEDSENPHVGYLSTQNTTDTQIEGIDKHLKTTPSTNLIARFTSRTNPFGNGIVKRGYIIADDYDPRAFENWIAGKFRIPSILVEAPFKQNLEVKTRFQKDALDSVLTGLKNGRATQ